MNRNYSPKHIADSTTYEGVSIYNHRGKTIYKGKVGRKAHLGFDSEREAALFVDRTLIEKGQEPVNILKRK